MLINGLFENGYVVYAAALFYGVCACVDCVVRPPDAQHLDSLWLESLRVGTQHKKNIVSLWQYGKMPALILPKKAISVQILS